MNENGEAARVKTVKARLSFESTWHTSKHKTPTQWWVNVGPASSTLYQHWLNIGSMFCDWGIIYFTQGYWYIIYDSARGVTTHNIQRLSPSAPERVTYDPLLLATHQALPVCLFWFDGMSLLPLINILIYIDLIPWKLCCLTIDVMHCSLFPPPCYSICHFLQQVFWKYYLGLYVCPQGSHGHGKSLKTMGNEQINPG